MCTHSTTWHSAAEGNERGVTAARRHLPLSWQALQLESIVSSWLHVLLSESTDMLSCFRRGRHDSKIKYAASEVVQKVGVRWCSELPRKLRGSPGGSSRKEICQMCSAYNESMPRAAVQNWGRSSGRPLGPQAITKGAAFLIPQATCVDQHTSRSFIVGAQQRVIPAELSTAGAPAHTECLALSPLCDHY